MNETDWIAHAMMHADVVRTQHNLQTQNRVAAPKRSNQCQRRGLSYPKKSVPRPPRFASIQAQPPTLEDLMMYDSDDNLLCMVRVKILDEKSIVIYGKIIENTINISGFKTHIQKQIQTAIALGFTQIQAKSGDTISYQVFESLGFVTPNNV